MLQYVDLHLHSTASDGTDAPGALPALAERAGLCAIALTDHDTTVGHEACAAACERIGIRFVPGIELSAERGQPRGSMHILGYFIDPTDPTLAGVIEEVSGARRERAPQIVEKLNDLRVAITLEEVEAQAGGAFIGRPHIAEVLRQKGYVKSIKDAFTRYLGQNAPAYVRKDNLPTERAIEAIHAAGGLAVLAHPVQLRSEDEQDLQQTVQRLVDQGLDGLEIHHADHTAAQVQQYRQLAHRLDLLTTGGSDYHGLAKTIALGSQRVPHEHLDQLDQRLQRAAQVSKRSR